LQRGHKRWPRLRPRSCLYFSINHADDPRIGQPDMLIYALPASRLPTSAWPQAWPCSLRLRRTELARMRTLSGYRKAYLYSNRLTLYPIQRKTYSKKYIPGLNCAVLVQPTGGSAIEYRR
jgi:hypothetical protein